MSVAPLENLQQRITQRELELQTLRQQLKASQSQLTDLTQRKEKLLTQLRQVEAKIASLGTGSPASTKGKPTSASSVMPTSHRATPAAGQLSMPDLIVVMLRETGKPMTARQLSDEALRLGYHTVSRNFVKAIEARIHDLKEKGLLKRAPGQPGYILAPAARTAKIGKTNSYQSAPQMAKKTATQAAGRPTKPERASNGSTTFAAPKSTKPAHRQAQPTLREVLTSVLRKNRKPLSGGELARQALAAGYRSQSNKFADVVWSLLGQMDNVEHVPNQGYRLKRTTS